MPPLVHRRGVVGRWREIDAVLTPDVSGAGRELTFVLA